MEKISLKEYLLVLDQSHMSKEGTALRPWFIWINVNIDQNS